MNWIDDLVPEYGTVTGQFVMVAHDSADEDLTPDVQPLNGTVLLTPTVTAGRINDTVFAQIAPVPARIFGGQIVDDEDVPGIRILSTDTNIVDADWAWRATFQIDSGIRLQPLDFKVDAGKTVHLTGQTLPIDHTPHQIIQGEPGASAYEIAVANGFEGTEQEWVDTIPTGASVTVSEGGIAGGTVTLESGMLRFALTIPRGDWNRGEIRAGGSIEDLTGTAAQGFYRIESTSVAGLPVPHFGNLQVGYTSGSGRTIQTFTSTTPGTPIVMERIHSAGAWGAWLPKAWNRGPLSRNVDWDTLRATGFGAWAIQFTDHPNAPVGSVGTLEVLPATGMVIQRFTTWEVSPREYKRIARNATEWGPWAQSPSAAALDILLQRIDQMPTGGEGVSAIPRGGIEARPATVEPLSSPSTVGGLSADRSRVWTALSSTLRYSDDDGRTWTSVGSFPGASMESTLLLDNGEVLCTGLVGARSRRVAWVSSGLASGSPTFTEVLVARYPGIKFAQAWSMSTHGRIVLLNEYGPKAGMPWPNIPGDENGNVPRGEAATRTYLSMDYGRTWKVVFDLHEYLTTQQGRSDSDLQHLHGVAWDPYWDRIWISFGDGMGGKGSNGIVFSDDLGETWQTAAYTPPGTVSTWQVVGIQPMPRCVLFFGDTTAAVMRINRTEGKHSGPYTVQTAYESTATGKHLCQGFTRVKRKGDDAPLIAAFSSEGAVAQDFVVATLDGFKFAEVWRNPDTVPPGMGARTPVGPTIRGQIVFCTNALGGTLGTWATVRVPATGY